MRAIILVGLLAASATTTQVQAQGAGGANAIIESLFQSEDQGCTPEVRISLTDAIRAGIETEVKRAEESIKDPISTAALTCFDSLMNINLDFATIRLPSVSGLLQAATESIINQVCSLANEKLQEVTAPLQEALALPSFDAINIPGVSGGGGGQIIDFGSITIAPPAGSGGGGIQVRPGRDIGEGSLMRETFERLYGGGR